MCDTDFNYFIEYAPTFYGIFYFTVILLFTEYGGLKADEK